MCVLVEMETTDGPYPSPSPPRACEIAVSGPHVASAQPLVTVFSQAKVKEQDFHLLNLHFPTGLCVNRGN